MSHYLYDTTESTSINTGAFVISGGLGVQGALNVGKTGTFINLVAGTGTISTATVSSLSCATGSITNLTVSLTGTLSNLVAGTGTISTATVSSLSCATGSITNLTVSSTGTLTNLVAGTGTIQDIAYLSKLNLSSTISNLCITGTTGISGTINFAGFSNTYTGATGTSSGQLVQLNGSIYGNGYNLKGDLFDETQYNFLKTSHSYSSPVFASCCSSNGKIVYGYSGSTAIYFSRDFGKSFIPTSLPGLTTPRKANFCCSSDGAILIVAENANNGTMRISNNYGSTFFAIPGGINFGFHSVCCSSDARYIYAVNKGTFQIRVSSNYGASFSTLTNSPTPATSYIAVCCSSDGRVIYAIDFSSFVTVSTDYGNSFQTFNIPFTDTVNGSIVCSGDGSKMMFADNNDNIWITSGFGNNYICPLNIGGSGGKIEMAMSKSGNRIVFCVSAGAGANVGVYYSTDGGSTWTKTWFDNGSATQFYSCCMSDDGSYFYTVTDTKTYYCICEKNTILDTTNAISSSTGACIISGGLGTVKSIYGGLTGSFDTVISRSTQDAMTGSTGSMISFGGLSVAKAIFCSGTGIFTNLMGSGNRAVYSDSNGYLTNTASDQRLKTNITTLEYGTADVLNLNPIRFNWVDTNRFGSQNEIGLIAQDVKKIFPEIVGSNSDGTLSLDYSHLTPILINCIKQQQTKISSLENRIQVLENK